MLRMEVRREFSFVGKNDFKCQSFVLFPFYRQRSANNLFCGSGGALTGPPKVGLNPPFQKKRSHKEIEKLNRMNLSGVCCSSNDVNHIFLFCLLFLPPSPFPPPICARRNKALLANASFTFVSFSATHPFPPFVRTSENTLGNKKHSRIAS